MSDERRPADRQEPASGGKPFVTARDLVEWTGVSERTIRAAFARGDIPGAQRETGDGARGRWRAPYDDAVAWAQSRRRVLTPAELRPAPAIPGGDELNTAALERAVDRARIVELERDVLRTERDALNRRVEALEERVRELKDELVTAGQLTQRLAAVFAELPTGHND